MALSAVSHVREILERVDVRLRVQDLELGLGFLAPERTVSEWLAPGSSAQLSEADRSGGSRHILRELAHGRRPYAGGLPPSCAGPWSGWPPARWSKRRGETGTGLWSHFLPATSTVHWDVGGRERLVVGDEAGADRQGVGHTSGLSISRYKIQCRAAGRTTRTSALRPCERQGGVDADAGANWDGSPVHERRPAPQ